MITFAMPALPSFSSVRNFLNTSPPVVYPSAPAPEREREREREQERQTRSRSDSIQNTPTQRTRPRAATSASQIQPTPGPRGFACPLFSPSPHDVEVQEEWTPIRRRHSVVDGLRLDGSSNPAQQLYERGRYAKPERPAHRRTQSVARLGTLSSPMPTPTNRLVEISRDPKLNSSAISLPTLCESQAGSCERHDQIHALMPSPIVRARERRLSKAGAIGHAPFSPVDPLTPSPLSNSSYPFAFPEALDMSEADEERGRGDRASISVWTGSGVRPSDNHNTGTGGSVGGGERRHTCTRSLSSVPPPMTTPQAYQQHQQRRALPRPLVSDVAGITAASAAKTTCSDSVPTLPKKARSQRSYSAMDIDIVPQVRPRGILHRQGSVPALANLSDVSVMATWAFPSDASPNLPLAHPHTHQHRTTDAHFSDSVSPATEHLYSSSVTPRGSRRRSVDQPSDRLRERLQLLSSLDTSSPAISSTSASVDSHTPTPTMSSSSLFLTPRPLGRAKTAPTQGTSHRYTHSSPHNALPLAPVSLSGPVDTRPMSSVQPLLPPPRPPRRPTTTRLRQPNPLSMPVEPAPGPFTSSSNENNNPGFNRTNSFAELGSSPGSMISDHLSAESESINIPSPSSSVLSLPTLQHRHARRQSQVQPTHAKTESQGGLGLGFGFGFGLGLGLSAKDGDTGRSRGYGYATEVSSVETDNILESLSIRLSRCFSSVDGTGDGSESGHDVSMADHGHGDDDEELDVHEQYLSLDDI